MKIICGMVALIAVGSRVADAQCYTFASGSGASLSVDITNLPAPTMPDPGIYQYSSSSGLAATVSLTVGQTTYTPSPSLPIDLEITVSSDPTISFSQFSLNVAFTTTGNTVVGALPSLAWSGTFFQNGNLPAALPPVSASSDASMLVSVEFVDTTSPLTLVGSCSPFLPPPYLSEIAVFRSTSTAPNSLMQWIEDTDGNNLFDGSDQIRNFGLSGLPGSTLPDVAVTGDFFGTGVTEIGVFRCPARGQPGVCQWFIDANNNGRWDGVSGGDAVWDFGLAGDTPVVGDWTGSGIAKIGVMRCPVAGVCTWYLDIGNKHTYDPATVGTFQFGLPGDKPVINNWTGLLFSAPVDNIGVFRCPSFGVCTWIVDTVGLTGISTLFAFDVFSVVDAQYSFGLAGDIPVIGNRDNTGQRRIGVFRPNSPLPGSAEWIVDTNGDHTFEAGTDQIFYFGLAGDQPLAGVFRN